MNGDALELMKELGRIHADLKQDIGGVRTDLAGFKGSIEARVGGLEKDVKDEKFWNNVKAATGPFMVLLHVGAKKIGINI
jgi:hypothetical protein